MAQQYTRQHKRGRKLCYKGIQRGSSFFVVLARCMTFPRTFPPHWKKYARKHEKGLFWAIFRHWQQVNTLFYKCTIKLFLLATSKRKSRFFERIKRWSARSGAFWAFSGRKGAFMRWSKKSADLNGLPRRVGL